MAKNEESLPLTDADKTQDEENVNEIDFSMEEFCCEISPTDATLIVEGKPIPINKLILALASPVFKAMFSGYFKESDAKEIPLPGKKFNEFVEFLRCIYPNTLKRITSENVDAVLPLAHEYQVAQLVSSCETVLITQLKGRKCKEDVYRLTMTAVEYDLKELKEECIKVAANRPLQEIEETGSKHGFPDDLMNAIKLRLLNNLAAYHRDAFLPVDTKTAFYKILGNISNEHKLVTQFQNGNVFGNFKTLRLVYGTELKFEMRVNDSTYMMKLNIGKQKADFSSFRLKDLSKMNHNHAITLNIKSHSTMNDTNQFTCFVYIVNWMDRKQCITKRKEFTLGQAGTANFRLDSGTTTCIFNECLKIDNFREYSTGYMTDDMYDIQVYLFVENNVRQPYA